MNLHGNNLLDVVSYAPLIAYCNMFSVYYLEIISSTKRQRNTNKSNQDIGHYVNILVTGFYIVLFFVMIAIALSKGWQNKTDGST